MPRGRERPLIRIPCRAAEARISSEAETGSWAEEERLSKRIGTWRHVPAVPLSSSSVRAAGKKRAARLRAQADAAIQRQQPPEVIELETLLPNLAARQVSSRPVIFPRIMFTCTCVIYVR